MEVSSYYIMLLIKFKIKKNLRLSQYDPCHPGKHIRSPDDEHVK